MSNGWTGGQYSIFRCVLALLLLGGSAAIGEAAGASAAASFDAIPLFPGLLDLPLPWGPRLAVAVWVLACGALALGRLDRVGAIVLLYALASFVDAGWARADRGLLCVALLLVAHAFVPAAPYGSWSARGRLDPRGDWRMPGAVRLAVWDLSALGLVFIGAIGVLTERWPGSPAAFADRGAPIDLVLGIGCLSLVWVAPARRWIWCLLSVWLILLFLLEPGWSSAGSLMLAFFLLDPDWIPSAGGRTVETLFYDGHCGLCHRAVRFVLAEDRGPEFLHLAPLDSDRFRDDVNAAERAALPDSIALRSADGRLRLRSDAVLRLLARLGGLWRLAACAARWVPRFLRDGVYDLVAAWRHRLFARRDQACPLLPPDLRDRFEGADD